MSFLNTLWSEALASPLLTVLVFVAIAFIAAAIVTWIEIVREGLGARVTTSDDLHRDAYTAERQARLRGIQGGRRDRRTS